MRALLFALAAISIAGCFNPDQPVCAFSCGPDNLCPDGYQCQADGFCHKAGHTGACPLFTDAAVPDLGSDDLNMSMPDLIMSTDGDVGDGPMSMPDLSQPDLFTVDMAISCVNLTQDGTETDVDCGGATCVGLGKTCADTKMCAGSNANCTSGFCGPGNRCFPAHCNNSSPDPGLGETDQDCGGACPKCVDTKTCAVDADCTNANCVSLVCRPFTAVAPCTTPGSYVTNGGNAISFPGGSLMYTPACLRISRATLDSVTWNADGGNDFSMHPLTPSVRGSGGSPITLTNTAITTQGFTFSTDGFFAFYCGVHGSADDGTGMAGVIQVVP